MRLLSVDMVQKANNGHPGLPLGAADIAHVVFSRHLKFNPQDPTWANRDRFILSAGHGSALLYSTLFLHGYNYTVEDLQKFRCLHSKCPGHPEYNPALGIETTTGPLGQGIANAVGMAIAERVLANHINAADLAPLIDHRIWVLMGDGCMEEGVSHEAASLAGHLGLDHLFALYDDNSITIDGNTELAFSDETMSRFAAYGWDVRRCDGNNMQSIDEAIRAATGVSGRPHLIVCKTTIGLKSPLAGTAKVHGSPLGPEGVAKTKLAYGRPADKFFVVPELAVTRCREAGARGAAADKAWNQLLNTYKEKAPKSVELLNYCMTKTLPANWEAALPSFNAGTAPMATRKASEKVISALVAALPSPLLLGGSADLTPSNLTKGATAVDIGRNHFKGNYIHYGVREHGMASAVNGLCTYGLHAFGSTFFVFTDYCRPSLRMAALMKLPSIFVMTHDSIGVGEDGPTHQPIEHLLVCRAIPNMHVIRPCDANETSAAWRLALERTNGPTILVLTRQELPLLTPPGSQNVSKGAYILGEEPAEPLPNIVLLATGSEVQCAVEAQKLLLADGIRARVVSMPCMELFDQQPQSYKDFILPQGVPRVGIEAGLSATWFRYGCAAAVGIDTFGASAPAKFVFEHFEINGKHLAEVAKPLAKK